MRECGECGLCCKLPKIRALEKPAGKWCPHWDKEKHCTIYETRPEVCRNFVCLWLSDDMPDKYKPLRTRAVAMQDGEGVTVFTDRGIDPTTTIPAPILVWQRRGLRVRWAKQGE